MIRWLRQLLPAQREAVRTLRIYNTPYFYDNRFPCEGVYPRASQLQEMKSLCSGYVDIKTEDMAETIVLEEGCRWQSSIRVNRVSPRSLNRRDVWRQLAMHARKYG